MGGVDVDPNRVEKFNAEHNIPNAFPSLDAAIAWGEFDAVANVTPDSVHHSTSIAALKAGKHVFCEKPLATDAIKAFEMVEVAEQSGLINMVNLTYRNVAQLQKAREIVLSGEIGTVRHVEASYLQSWLVSKAWGDWRTESQWLWRLSRKHGSNGVLGDIGVHFPPTDERWRGADSLGLLRHCVSLVADRGWRLGNADITIVCERPKVGPHAALMRERIAEACGVALDAVSVKATTSEKLGFTGRGEGIAAQAVALLVRA